MTGAKADFHRSFEIHNGLDEPEFAAQARWEELMLSGALPKNASRVLSAESYPVRVSVVERFLTDAATSKKRAIARRADPPDAYWARLAEEARGLDRQYISGTWRPGRAGRTLRDWDPVHR